MNEAQKTTHEWEEKIKHYTNEALKNLNIATADRIAYLEKRVTELEAKLASKSN
jgi:polyhydroxyalkanoate synthesis regulator phasin